MVTKMWFKDGDIVPFHSHPNTQSGYIMSGVIRLMTQSSDDRLGPGDAYSIPADLAHSVEVIEGGEVIDVFSPPREDFL